ncbi:MAG: caspase family protein [Pikeienuella sp.]
MRHFYSLTVCLVILFGMAAKATAQDYVALLIGNANYQHEGPLDNPFNDVDRMRTTLSALGYEVDVAYDLTKVQVERALQRFSRKADRAQNALIFYSGHGMAIDDVNYVIPVDASLQREKDAQYEAVPLQLFSDAVSGAANLQIIIFDACRDNNFLDRKGGRRGYQAMNPVKSQIIAFSTALGTPAYDGYGALSPYTQALTEKLAAEPNKDVRILFSELGNRVKELIGEEQTPWVSSSSFAQGHYPIGVPVQSSPAQTYTAPLVQLAPTPAPEPQPVQPSQPTITPSRVSETRGKFFAMCGNGAKQGEYDVAFSDVSLAAAYTEAARRWPSCPYSYSAANGQCIAIARSARGAWRWYRKPTAQEAERAALDRCREDASDCSLRETYCTDQFTTLPMAGHAEGQLMPPRNETGRYLATCGLSGHPFNFQVAFSNASRSDAKSKLEQKWPNCPQSMSMTASLGQCIAVAWASSGAWAGRRRSTLEGAKNAAIARCKEHKGKDCQIVEAMCTTQ